MAGEDTREVQIAREVLRRMLRGSSLGQISVEIGKARNYLARMLNGAIPLSFNVVVEALHAAKIVPADYFRQVAEECSGALEDDAVRDVADSFGSPPSLRRIEERIDEINERLTRLASKVGQE